MSCENYPTDCLVLRIDEIESESGKKDTTMYIFYDKNEELFVIRGKRINWPSYSFYCNKLKDLAEFISTVVSSDNLWTYTLYNYDNLLKDSDDVTFDYLDYNAETKYEVVAFDKQYYDYKMLNKMLGFLRNVYNYY